MSLPSKVNSRYFSSQNISAKQQCPSPLSVCTVCVCVCVCLGVCVCVHVCASFACVCIFFTNVLYCQAFRVFKVLAIHYVLAFYFVLIYISIADNISTSMYIMCAILCLFSALSHRVGTLQISMIIINCAAWDSVLLSKHRTLAKMHTKHSQV